MNISCSIFTFRRPLTLNFTRFRMATTSARRQPPWTPPKGTTLHPQLEVYNSLTRSKVPFVPIDPAGKKVTWYACGPTVYDDSHLGHARNYVTTDILRRLLRDYFKFDVRFIMNTTDIDDKIILRARQQHLYEEYQKQHRYITQTELYDVHAAWKAYLLKYLPRLCDQGNPAPENFQVDVQRVYGGVLNGQAVDADGKPDPNGKPGDREAKIKMHINTAISTARALTEDLKQQTPLEFYHRANDVMCFMLDQKYGHTIKGNDHAIFLKLTQYYEKRFFQDMADLNVLYPDQLVRVTEYGAQIAEFVAKIVEHKFGYVTSDGSVYFDIKAFEAAGHHYARLEPWNRGDKALQADGEGALSQRTSEKRSDADFALWKASKPGEPSWPSLWGPGRPGWHIECSAMASSQFGRHMDLHSGGIDLAFPHHDNELAQSEAFWQDGKPCQWVNYFLHVGHLSIQGAKMSKSLKNFTTIRSALDRKEWTGRSLRIVFLLGKWADGIEITDDLVQEGVAWEDRVDNFFIKVIDLLQTGKAPQPNVDSTLSEKLAATEATIYKALCDSFNTPDAMMAISTLINAYNSADKTQVSLQETERIGLFVTRMVNIFGLNGNAPAEPHEIGWAGLDIPDSAKSIVYPIRDMRDELRQTAISQKTSPKIVQEIVSKYTISMEPQQQAGFARQRPPFARIMSQFGQDAVKIVSNEQNGSPTWSSSPDFDKEILALCDRVRDVDLWKQDIYLEDRDNAPALVRPVTAGLRKARQEKEDRARKKDEDRRKREQEAREKLEKGKLNPRDMFRQGAIAEEFSTWDEEGIPLMLRDGAPVAQSRRKKLKKDWERQKKLHEQWLMSLAAAARTNGDGAS